jgi:hypothetical protein
MRFRQHCSFPFPEVAPAKSTRSYNRLVGPGTEHKIPDPTQTGGGGKKVAATPPLNGLRQVFFEARFEYFEPLVDQFERNGQRRQETDDVAARAA